MLESIKHTDVLIVGGGPSGASVALSLLNYSKLDVTIIEQSDFNVTRVGENVSSSIFSLIDYLKLSKTDFDDHSFIPAYASKAYWGSDQVSSINTIFTTEEASFQIDREKFDFKLIETAAQRGAVIYPRTKCFDFEKLENKNWLVSLNHPEEGKFKIQAKYLVDASGRSAKVCRKVGGISQKHDALVGVGLFLKFKNTSKPFEKIIESTEFGWWYAACLPDNKIVITFFSDADIVSDFKLHQIKEWRKLLHATKHIKQLLDRGEALSKKLWVRNAQTQISNTNKLDKFIAIGDAAASFDPISSMGIGFSISSAIYAGKHIAQELEVGVSTVDIYQNDLLQIFNQYNETKQMYYRKETRWSTSKFWLRRN